jgi:hypothetical protein
MEIQVERLRQVLDLVSAAIPSAGPPRYHRGLSPTWCYFKTVG